MILDNPFRIYELTDPPELLNNPNDYFVRYAETRDSAWFDAFLHHHEPTINKYAQRFMDLYDVPMDHLADLKQIYIITLWEAMQNYDPGDPVVLLQKIRYPVLDRWHDYTRTVCGTVTIPNPGTYKNLRKVARIYFEHCDTLSEQALEEKITEEVNLSAKTIRELVQTAIAYKYPISMDADPSNDEIEDTVPESLQGRMPSSLDAEQAYHKKELRKQLRAAISTLSPKEQKLLELSTGICLNCYHDIERKTYQEISLILGYAGESTVEKRRKVILDKLRKELLK